MSVLTAPTIPTPAVSTPPPAAPGPTSEPFGGLASIRKFTVDEYHQMIKQGILSIGEPIELLEGYLVNKMPRSPQHDYVIMALNALLMEIISKQYVVRPQCAATYNDSEPEPDIVVVRGPRTNYKTQHPSPADSLLIIESAASSLTRDRVDKARIYARAGLPVYWIVNVEERVIEVHSQPSGPILQPAYSKKEEFRPGDTIPVILDGTEVGRIAVADVMP